MVGWVGQFLGICGNCRDNEVELSRSVDRGWVNIRLTAAILYAIKVSKQSLKN